MIKYMTENQKKKALFITTTNIFDGNGNGGVKASKEHLNMVQKYFGEDNVQVCVFALPEEIGKINSKNEREDVFPKLVGNFKLLIAALGGCRVYLPWEERKFFQYIDSVLPDLLFLDFSILGRIMRRKANYKTVVFFHNMEADYTYNKVKKEGLVYYPAYMAAKKNDKWATLADRVICLNERDSRRMEFLYGRKSDLNLPITFEDSFDIDRTNKEYDREILFLGSLFGPNQDGIEWFIENVMPSLENVRLNIVGNGFETKKEEYEKYKNVSVVGRVDRPSEYYYRHAAVVMPIRYGAGMKVKTAEAMMYGRHIFASDEALEGYEVDGIDGIERCNTAEEYIKAINNFFNSGKKVEYEYYVRKLFLEKYESNVVYSNMQKLFEKLI